MPARRDPRQAESARAWLSEPVGRGLLLAAQAAWSEADFAGAGGQAWLRLLPDAAWPLPDPPGRYAGVWTLAPSPEGWQGSWRAPADRLPLANAAISRIDLRFVLETSPVPRAVIAECARVLCDDGRLLAFGLNPFGAARLRWARRGLNPLSRRETAALLRAEGLEVLAQRTLGPRWGASAAVVDPVGAAAPLGLGRVAWAVLAARRSAPLTPLRRGRPTWRASPGVPAS